MRKRQDPLIAAHAQEPLLQPAALQPSNVYSVPPMPRVRFDPRGQSLFREFARRQRLYGHDGIRLRSRQLASIHLQKHVDDRQRDSLVAIGEAVTLRKREPVRGCQSRHGRLRLRVVMELLRPGQRSFEAVRTRKSYKPAVLLQQSLMNRDDRVGWDPDRRHRSP